MPVSAQAAVGRPPVLLDISRLLWRARRRAPTGIDRVELAYAQHWLAGPHAASSSCTRGAYGVLHLFGHLFALNPRASRRFIEALADRWHSAPRTRGHRLLTLVRMYLGLVAPVWWVGPWLRYRLRVHEVAPIFLVVSHHHLARGHVIERLRRRYRVRTTCLIHDLIPLAHPEYYKRGWERRYRRICATLARSIDAVIAGTEATAASLRANLERRCVPASLQPPLRIAPLGVRDMGSSGSAPALGKCDSLERPTYFVALGTIEPRKNHLLLLNLWSRLALRPWAPRLMLIGARGWENEQVVDMLERSVRLRGLVDEHSSAGDAEVVGLLAGARALLAPSFAEGFGLPLAEALASGVPVICSDLASFREVGAAVPEYLDPLDLPAWLRMVLEYAAPGSLRRAAQLQRLARWRAPRWEEHFGAVERLFADLDRGMDAIALPGERQSLHLQQNRA